MALYMPPIARKKKVPEKYNPDTFRVVSIDAEDFHPKFADAVTKPVYSSDPRPARKLLPGIPIRETRILPHTTYDFRAHNPHPVSCGFLRHNARLLNEPVCTVFTRTTHPEQHLWWPSRTSSDPLRLPDYTLDSSYRADYQFDNGKAPRGSTRHTANPNTDPALGSVPVNFLGSRTGGQRLYQEGISFEHQYNSRDDPNYPVRSKRHGAFVWDRMKPDKVQLLLDYHESVAQRKAADEARSTETEGVASSPPQIPHQYDQRQPSPPDLNLTIAETHPKLPKSYIAKFEPEPVYMEESIPSPPIWHYPEASRLQYEGNTGLGGGQQEIAAST